MNSKQNKLRWDICEQCIRNKSETEGVDYSNFLRSIGDSRDKDKPWRNSWISRPHTTKLCCGCSYCLELSVLN